jgi:DNA-binding transcriptional regulator YiaG
MCKLKLSQQAFARCFGFSTRSVQRWEQEQAVPDRQNRILLRLGV